MKTIYLIIVLFFTSSTLSAQNFLEPVFIFSSKRNAIFSLRNGDTIKGRLIFSKMKKGLFDTMTAKDKEGVKHKLKASEISNMYLPVGRLNDFVTKYSKYDNVSNWDDDSILNQEYITDGYAYYEQVEIIINKEKRFLLMQLLNPAYCKKIKVYHNPNSGETAGLAFDGLTVAGGHTKSDYVKKENNLAFKLKKKSFNETFLNLFSDCESFMRKYEKTKELKEFEAYVYEYAQNCNKDNSPEQKP